MNARFLGILALAAALAPGAAVPAAAQRFHPSDPVWKDADDLHVPVRPSEMDWAGTWDALTNTFRKKPENGRIPPARGVNSLGEVPDSTWFENRLGTRDLSVEDVVRGPNRGPGPDTTGAWTVLRGKSSGITPGFTIRDSRGDLFFVKSDPRDYFGLSTGAEVIGTRLFHAFGYHVPETWIVYVRRDQIKVDRGATIKLLYYKPRAMNEADLDKLVDSRAQLPDGRIRVVASRAVPGVVVGRARFYGTRPDDPNDVIPHEDRRDLRGYRVMSAWLNHDDSRSVNTLDSWTTENGRSFIRHYKQDFSSILGSGSDWRRQNAPQNPRGGNEYIIDFPPMLKTAASLGVWNRPWHSIRYDVYPEVGAIEAERFDPDAWVPEFPNMAFLSMLPEDAFWAARIVSRFTDEMIRAVVASADLRAPEAEEHLARVTIARRDKVTARYFSILNPLADFRVESPGGRAAVGFRNYGEARRLATVEAYEYQWFRFDNATGKTEPIGGVERTGTPSLPLPAERPEYLMVRVRTIAAGQPAWKKAVDVFVRTAGEGTVVGVDRES
jgi:hypothetical protein